MSEMLTNERVSLWPNGNGLRLDWQRGNTAIEKDTIAFGDTGDGVDKIVVIQHNIAPPNEAQRRPTRGEVVDFAHRAAVVFPDSPVTVRLLSQAENYEEHP